MLDKRLACITRTVLHLTTTTEDTETILLASPQCCHLYVNWEVGSPWSPCHQTVHLAYSVCPGRPSIRQTLLSEWAGRLVCSQLSYISLWFVSDTPIHLNILSSRLAFFWVALLAGLLSGDSDLHWIHTEVSGRRSWRIELVTPGEWQVSAVTSHQVTRVGAVVSPQCHAGCRPGWWWW